MHMHSHAHKLCLTNNAWGKYWHHINAFYSSAATAAYAHCHHSLHVWFVNWICC